MAAHQALETSESTDFLNHMRIDREALTPAPSRASPELANPELAKPVVDVPVVDVPARHRLWRILGGIASAVLFTVAMVVLYYILRDLDMDELRSELGKLSGRQIALASLFTVASYAMLTGYDALALRQIGAKGIGYPTTALASFTSYAVSFTLGFPLLTAGAVRLWVYGAKGLSAPKIASLTIIAGITFWLGMGLVLGFSLTTRPEAISRLNHISASFNLLLGVAVLAAAIAYVIFIALKPRKLVVQGWKFQLPGWRVTLGQVVLGVADVCASGGILFVLLPDQPDLQFGTFIAAYVFAHILGLASHAPGGAGVFETTLLLAFASIAPGRLIGAIILYRLFYYLAPFILALGLLGLHEIRKRLLTYKASSHDEEDDLTPG